MDRRRELGRMGERVAERYLVAHGIEVLGRNVAVAGGEIDLIAVVDGSVTAVEVRSVTGASDVGMLFPQAKLSQVHRLARAAGCHRVDLVAVRFVSDGVELRWLPDVR